MPASQQLLFPDPRPLVERLGSDFFRQLPESPGVYLMRDGANTVLYVGKARNLRKRLTSYRVANPDRMPRRHLRLLRAVARIELEPCQDEEAALAREAELLRQLKPKYNRAGTWPATPRFLAWREAGENLEFTVTAAPAAGWEAVGPMGSVAQFMRIVLVRLMWCAIHPDRGVSQMPAGWARGRLEGIVSLRCEPVRTEAVLALRKLFSGQPDVFCDWVAWRFRDNRHPFEMAAMAEDFEALRRMLPAAVPDEVFETEPLAVPGPGPRIAAGQPAET